MGASDSKVTSLSPASDLSRHLLWCIQQSARLDDSYSAVRATLLHATPPLYTAIDPAVLLGQLNAHVKTLTTYADELIHNADPSQTALTGADAISGYHLLNETATISALGSNIYRDDDGGDGVRERGMPQLSAEHSSCKERMEIAAKYLILQSILSKLVKAATMASKVRERDSFAVARLSRGRRKNLPPTEFDRLSRFTADAREHVGRIVEKSDVARQTFCWLYRDFQLAMTLHQLNETTRIIRGVRCRWNGRTADAYEYPRKLGIGDDLIIPQTHDAALDIKQPQTSEYLNALNRLSQSIILRSHSIDSLSQHNERSAMALCSVVVDSAFRMSLSGDQLVGMSPRLVSLLGLHNRTAAVSVNELRAAVANMRLRIETLSAAIVAMECDPARANSSSYHRRELLVECAVEKRALRDVYKYFHPPIARYCYDKLDDEVRTQSADVGLIYEELAKVEKASAYMFPPPLSDPPPTRLPIQPQHNNRTPSSPSSSSAPLTQQDPAEEKSYDGHRPAPLHVQHLQTTAPHKTMTSPSKRVGFQIADSTTDQRRPSSPSSQSTTADVPPSPSLPTNHHTLPSPSFNIGATPLPPPRIAQSPPAHPATTPSPIPPRQV